MREADSGLTKVLDAPEVGVDGLLGQSFLSRFSYRVDRDHDPKLILDTLKKD